MVAPVGEGLLVAHRKGGRNGNHPYLMSFSYFPGGVLKMAVWHASPRLAPASRIYFDYFFLIPVTSPSLRARSRMKLHSPIGCFRPTSCPLQISFRFLYNVKSYFVACYYRNYIEMFLNEIERQNWKF